MFLDPLFQESVALQELGRSSSKLDTGTPEDVLRDGSLGYSHAALVPRSQDRYGKRTDRGSPLNWYLDFCKLST